MLVVRGDAGTRAPPSFYSLFSLVSNTPFGRCHVVMLLRSVVHLRVVSIADLSRLLEFGGEYRRIGQAEIVQLHACGD